MKRTAPALAIVLALTVAGCSGLKANSTFDPQFDFSAPRTFAWTDQPPLEIDGRRDDITHGRIVDAVETELGNRGFSRQSSPTYQIAYYVGVQSIPQATTTGGYYGGGWGRWGYGWGGVGMSTTRVTYYDEASLTLDVLDAGSGTLVWRGTVKGTVDDNKPQAQRDAQLQEAVQKMLADFPPGS